MYGRKEVFENEILNTNFLKYVIKSGKSGVKIESCQLNCGYEPLWPRWKLCTNVRRKVNRRMSVKSAEEDNYLRWTMRNLLVVLKNGVGMGCYIYIYIYIERWGGFLTGVPIEALGFSNDAFDEGILNFGWFPWRWFPIENSRPASNFVTRVRVLKKKKIACSTELRLIIESTLCQKRTLYCPSFSSGIKRTALLRREVRHTSDLETENRKVKSEKWKVKST